MTEFYVNSAADEHGNAHYLKAVIEVTREPFSDGERFRVVGPPEFADKWPTVSPDYFEPAEGPARMLTDKEWQQVTGWPVPAGVDHPPLNPGDPIPPEWTGGMEGFVVGECGHRVAASEWRAGYRNCERDGG